jgi:hypothetical protein
MFVQVFLALAVGDAGSPRVVRKTLVAEAHLLSPHEARTIRKKKPND